MKKNHLLLAILFVLITLSSCSNSEDNYVPVSPVVVDLTQVPYPKLSDYKFFDGLLKDQKPALNVLPFQPASTLFTDYAHKKRFVWMPVGTKATYNSDSSVLELPVGAALIKDFYYDDVQNISPAGGTRIVETRVMIRKTDGWMFAEYVWNAEQTEAYYDMAGSFTDITWKDENNVVKSAAYRIPSEEQCIVCHKKRQIIDGNETTQFIPIGIKPQNLNFDLTYGTVSKNQLRKWVEMGYLEDGFSIPTVENTTVDYNDTSKSLDMRARSYVDINCSHCHGIDRHCDYRPMRFAFSETKNNPANMGVCVDTQDMQGFPGALSKIVTPGNINRSMMYYRLNTTDEAYRMPLHGRTIIHDEGLVLIEAWINSLEPCN
jgi:uncharacterized repeat protein (TIGR03806 family)